jgi:hypothetical protein
MNIAAVILSAVGLFALFQADLHRGDDRHTQSLVWWCVVVVSAIGIISLVTGMRLP